LQILEKRIVVNGHDKNVIIDGLVFSIDVPMPENVCVLRWDPSNRKPGYMECDAGGDSRHFNDPKILEPYIEAWRTAKVEHDARVEEERKAAQQARAREIEEREREMRDVVEDTAAFNEALTALSSTDHEVIKAMESKLGEEGKLSKDFTDKRNAARDVVKAERERLRRKGRI
jgi:hypothetical protein